MTIQEQMAILQAAMGGKRIECDQRDDSNTFRNVIDPINHHYDFFHRDYRIAPDPPEKKVRAWTSEEVRERMGLSVKRKSNDTIVVIVVVFGNGNLRLSMPIEETITADELFERYTMLDGSPCGVVE